MGRVECMGKVHKMPEVLHSGGPTERRANYALIYRLLPLDPQILLQIDGPTKCESRPNDQVSLQIDSLRLRGQVDFRRGLRGTRKSRTAEDNARK